MRDAFGSVFIAGCLLSFPPLAVAVTVGVLFWNVAITLVRTN